MDSPPVRRDPISSARFLPVWLRRLLKGAPVQKTPAEDFHAASTDADNVRQVTFTFAVIALAAKLAHADGEVKKEEFVAFCELFPMPHEERTRIHKLFTIASRDSSDAAHHARQIAELFPGRGALMEELVVRLCKVAVCDGDVTPQEMRLLEVTADGLGVRRAVILGALATRLPQVPPEKTGPYALLGVSRKASDDAVKKAYRDRIRELHPDRLEAEGRGAAEINAAVRRLAAVNDAYREIARRRKIR